MILYVQFRGFHGGVFSTQLSDSDRHVHIDQEWTQKGAQISERESGCLKKQTFKCKHFNLLLLKRNTNN